MDITLKIQLNIFIYYDIGEQYCCLIKDILTGSILALPFATVAANAAYFTVLLVLIYKVKFLLSSACLSLLHFAPPAKGSSIVGFWYGLVGVGSALIQNSSNCCILPSY